MDQIKMILLITGGVYWTVFFAWIGARILFGKKWRKRFSWFSLMGRKRYKIVALRTEDDKNAAWLEREVYSFKRLSRIGILAMLISIGVLALPMIRGNKIKNIQKNTEAQRRDFMVGLMKDILIQIKTETDEQRSGVDQTALQRMERDGYDISAPLVGRLAFLSQGLLPYRFRVNGKITDDPYSVERGQLLIALQSSNLKSTHYDRIYASADFTRSFLKDADLSESYLQRIDLRQSFLQKTNFEGADLRRSQLSGAILNEAILRRTNLYLADLSEAQLKDADLSASDLSNADLNQANLQGARLSNANFAYVRNLTAAQLEESQSLYNCKNLPGELANTLRSNKPCLFTEEGCR